MHGDGDRPSANTHSLSGPVLHGPKVGLDVGVGIALLLHAWTGWTAVERSHSGPDRHDRPVRVPSRPGGATTCTTPPRLTNRAGPSAFGRGAGTRRQEDEARAAQLRVPPRVACLRASRRACALLRALARRATGGWSAASVTTSDAVGNGLSARVPPQVQQPRRWAARLASESSVGPLVSNLLFVCLTYFHSVL